MIVNKISLKNFRNHQNISLNFSNSLNIITGNNGVGKTNIVEAIYYLSLARSFRGVEDATLIKEGCDYASIDATISEGNIKRIIRVLITKTGRKIFINNKPVSKLSELSNVVNVVLFEPKDVMIFRGLPKTRRDFIDINLSKKSPPYLNYLSKYEKLLKDRNNILKGETVDMALLEANTEMLIKIAGYIVSYRQMYVKDINDILNKIARALTGVKWEIEVIYYPYTNYNKDYIDNAKNAFNKALESDLRRKVTSIGPHREDFIVTLNKQEIGQFGSQGENRLVALALKLCPYFLIEDKDKRPIVVLDDVMSELDKQHKEQLINFLKKFEQVFITATKLEINGATQFHISNN